MVLFLIILPLFYSLINLLTLISKYFYSVTSNYTVWETMHDRFALVTFATTDFGAAISMELASKKINLILLGPNEEKLLELKKKIGNKIVVYHHAININNCKDYSFLEKYDIGLAICGIGHEDPCPSYFIDQNIDNIVEMNFRGPLNFMKFMTTMMAEKHKGYIVAISFGYSAKPHPHHALTTAIRRAFRSLSESMYYEMMQYNVNIEYMEIGGFVPLDSKTSKHSLFKPSVNKVAKSVVNTLGSSYFTVPYIFHFFQFIFAIIIPRFLLARQRYYRNENILRMKTQN